jgi:hypothetical protein
MESSGFLPNLETATSKVQSTKVDAPSAVEKTEACWTRLNSSQVRRAVMAAVSKNSGVGNILGTGEGKGKATWAGP